MKARTRILAGLGVFALSGCMTLSEEPTAAVCSTMECVSIGESMIAGQVSVIPRELLEDSRCPSDVQCVWAGRVRVTVDVTSRSRGEDAFTYRVELASDEPVGLFGGMLQLGEVAPAPAKAGAVLQPGDYRFGFSFAPDVMDQPATLAE